MILNKHQILKEVEKLPMEIYEAEKNYANALNHLKVAKFELAHLESETIKTKRIDGKSDKSREMQLLPHTKEQHDVVIRAQILADIAKADLNLKVNQFDSFKMLAGFLG
jgi:hypothetical protein